LACIVNLSSTNFGSWDWAGGMWQWAQMRRIIPTSEG